MKCNFRLPITIVFGLLIYLFISCNEKYSKKEALEQSFYSLKFKHEIAILYQIRNPYYINLVSDLDKGRGVNDSVIKRIEDISKDISVMNEKYISELDSLKTKHKKTEFFDATSDFLFAVRQLENKMDSLVISLLNPKSDGSKEEVLGKEVKNLAINLKIVENDYEYSESEFYKRNNIVQKEVDSLVGLIKK